MKTSAPMDLAALLQPCTDKYLNYRSLIDGHIKAIIQAQAQRPGPSRPTPKPEPDITVAQWVIRRNSDGIVRTVEEQTSASVSTIRYMYFDGGNYDCDCNRAQSFGDLDVECGEYEYTTLCLIDTNGNRYYGPIESEFIAEHELTGDDFETAHWQTLFAIQHPEARS